jgi:S1-C subfamily serine protease
MSPRLAQRIGMRGDIKGVVVVDVVRQSPAARLGLQPRDLIREVNGENIDTTSTLNRIASDGSRWWRFAIERNGQMLRQVLRY